MITHAEALQMQLKAKNKIEQYKFEKYIKYVLSFAIMFGLCILAS